MWRTGLIGGLFFAWAGGVLAQGLNSYGVQGLVDMPTALPLPDGELTFSTSHFVNQTRQTLTFQIAPRLTGSFRYAQLFDISPRDDGVIREFLYDRSFSLQYLIAPESDRFPAVAVGLNDIIGTGVYSSEYLVATRTLSDTVRVTAGIGWGRLAGVGAFDNPLGFLGSGFDVRPDRFDGVDTGGLLRTNNWFRGPAALFAGLEWRPTPDWTVVAEYSSDAYPYESPYIFERRSPLNFGLRYQLTDRVTLGAQYLYGSEIGLQVSYQVNPSRPRFTTGLEPAPPLVRSVEDAPVMSAEDAQGPLAAQLEAEGLTLHGYQTGPGWVRVEVENIRWRQAAQAVGRTARVLTRTMPADVARFEIVLVERGLAQSLTEVTRSDLEETEFALDGAWAMQARADIRAPEDRLAPVEGLFPRFDWSVAPYLTPSLFDPDNPLRADLGLSFGVTYEPAPGIILSGLLRQPVIGNLDESTRASDSILPRVRSDAWLYDKAAPALTRLTAAWYFQPGQDLYGRVTAGLLEPMFAGLSTELMWYPAGSRLALGAELNHVVQRDYDQMFDFRDYQVTTGHLSAYWDMGQGYTAQLDVGRYLAGDWGATLSLDRRFDNGWVVGAFATLTDVPFRDFGEGSFDKGIRLVVPIDWMTGEPYRETAGLVIRPILRDGGARLSVDGRLYDLLRPAGGAELADGWGRFWR
jgi:hypothetical protein